MQFVRGQAEDRYRGGAHADPTQVARYRGNPNRVKSHIVNVQPEREEENWPTARLFPIRNRIVEHNHNNTPILPLC